MVEAHICPYCHDPSYSGPAHPCCEWWSTRAPGLCPACAASKAAIRQRKTRRH